eukprot:4715000-Amphidinium_carterae.3
MQVLLTVACANRRDVCCCGKIELSKFVKYSEEQDSFARSPPSTHLTMEGPALKHCVCCCQSGIDLD